MLEVGNTSPNDARAVASACLSKLVPEAVETSLQRSTPWLVFTKMHDATKLEVTIPEDFLISTSSQGMKHTGRGSLVVNSFIQEDRICTPFINEVVNHSPVILDEEIGETLFMSTT